MIIDISHDCVPVIFDENMDIRILLDTGAKISVFTRGLEAFLEIFPNAVKAERKYLLGGFGGSKKDLCEVYTIPRFSLGGIQINNLPVVIATNKYISSEIVLSAYVFKKNRLTIDFDNDKIEILYSRPIYCILTSSEIDSNYAGGFAVFTQE